MGIFKALKGLEYLDDMRQNSNKKKEFEKVKEKSSELDMFETGDIYSLFMQEKAGMFGKRTFDVKDMAGEIFYTVKKEGTFKHPDLKVYDIEGKKVGRVRKKISNYKPQFTLDILDKNVLLNQTSMNRSMYEMTRWNWQVKSEMFKTIVCDEKWNKIIQIEWDASKFSSVRTDTYRVKYLDTKNEVAALVIALAIYISKRSEYQ